MSEYGTCPECGGEVVSRERRFGGNDQCSTGHVYPSSQTIAPGCLSPSGLKIYKFDLGDDFCDAVVDLPRGALVLHVGLQNERVTMWVLLDPRLKREPHIFQVVATGEGPRSSTLGFLGTVLQEGHPYVYHVFGPPSVREA